MKAIAARSNIKAYLDQEKERNVKLQNQITEMQEKMAEAEQDKLAF